MIRQRPGGCVTAESTAELNLSNETREAKWNTKNMIQKDCQSKTRSILGKRNTTITQHRGGRHTEEGDIYTRGTWKTDKGTQRWIQKQKGGWNTQETI